MRFWFWNVIKVISPLPPADHWFIFSHLLVLAGQGWVQCLANSNLSMENRLTVTLISAHETFLLKLGLFQHSDSFQIHSFSLRPKVQGPPDADFTWQPLLKSQALIWLAGFMVLLGLRYHMATLIKISSSDLIGRLYGASGTEISHGNPY